ncbi:hypothetical protein L6452_16495 [Arctium lappa]|uniref:Uncharacterized protein n=1 Tax=Arctium lappa TaxID=4217 RepID=A0ACB9C0Q9_ARCLA|nr:hypothetical protein L6452_16495 [Arctium lappa]
MLPVALVLDLYVQVKSQNLISLLLFYSLLIKAFLGFRHCSGHQLPTYLLYEKSESTLVHGVSDLDCKSNPINDRSSYHRKFGEGIYALKFVALFMVHVGKKMCD